MEADRLGSGNGLYLIPGSLVYDPSFPGTVFLTRPFIGFEGIKREVPSPNALGLLSMSFSLVLDFPANSLFNY